MTTVPSRKSVPTVPPPTISLDTAEARACMHLIGVLIRERAKAGRPTPHDVLHLYRRLDTAVSMSLRGQSKALRQRELGVSHVGTRVAAEILGWGVRRVRRHAADLGGKLVGDRLVFDEHEVREYATALQDREIKTS